MLSSRGTRWAKFDFNHGEQNAFDPSQNPDGVVNFGNAENWPMHHDINQFINANGPFDEYSCAYGEGFTGTIRLRNAMANHLNIHFKPASPFESEEITFAAGVTALNESCALLLCDPDADESVMLGTTIYGSFSKDLVMRTGVNLEHIHMGDIDQFSSDCVAAYEAGYEAATARGIKIKALLICNPHNPLGQCYTREALEGLLRLCSAKGIHLISDEIYALSVYNRGDSESETFTSVRALDFNGLINPNQVHVLYGLSKDFGCSGLRLGCIISQNLEFTHAVRAICRFASPSQYSMEISAKLLENQEFLTDFLRKSRERLLQSRILTENLLDQADIVYHKPGNAGFFIWMDLSSYLPLHETDGDGWAAQDLLAQRFTQAGVVLSSGTAYHAPKPGMFRIIHSFPEASLRKGIERISQVLRKEWSRL